MQYALSLESLDAGDTATAGAKAAKLGELARAGFPVPEGFVLTTEAYDYFLDASGLSELLPESFPSDAGAIETLAERIRDCINLASVPGEISEAIGAHHRALADRSAAEMIYAVRSSASAEDTSAASFAGQHATYYYVREARLSAMVKACWGSLWSSSAISYRQAQGLRHSDVQMAVLVQRMIPAEVSGVAFSVNPVSGSDQELVVESSWGMGAAIVDGRVNPDRFVVSRSDFAIRATRVGDKRFMVPGDLTSASLERLQEVPLDARQRISLSETQVRDVCGWTLKAERHFGGPQDLEWAFAGAELYVLQSRPVTVVGGPPDFSEVAGKYVLFKPLAENFSEPLTPLTADILSSVALPGSRILKGWVYLDLEQTRALIPLRLSDEALADLLYLSRAPDSYRIAWHRLPSFLLILITAYLTSAVFYARTRNMPDDFMEAFRGLAQTTRDASGLDPASAMSRLFLQPHLLEPVGNTALLINLSSSRYMMLLGVLKLCLKRWVPGLGNDAASVLCAGAQGVLSTDMGRRILHLAATARQIPQVAGTLIEHSPVRALSQLRDSPEAQPFLAELDEFLAIHGHRAVKEIDLSSPRWDEEPAPVMGMVRNYLLADTDTADLEVPARDKRALLRRQVQRGLRSHVLESSTRVRGRILDYLIAKARYFIKLRENSRFYHSMAFGVARSKVIRAEAQLLETGRLKCKDDTFFLSWKEVRELRDGAMGWRDVEDRIRSRRLEHVRLAKSGPPRTIGIETSEPTAGLEDLPYLQGQVASPGSCEGVARVITNPSVDIELEPGEILVAPYTDPAWTPLFLIARAAVVEVGSYLSHAGTIAREYGMPCVVDVAQCTSRIRTGTRLRIEGGKIWILEK